MLINDKELQIVRDILLTHIPKHEVWAFGSRIHKKNLKPFSDLDLAVIGKTPLDSLTYMNLKDTFSESNLPFKVDVLEWTKIDEKFQKIIEKEHEIIQIPNT